jgi:23S rRNA (uridine2552-2'-O)-methyltransferase
LQENWWDKGLVIASDILEMDALPDVTFLQGDFREEEVFEKLLNILNGRQVDVVISDMAPNTSGNRAVDQPRQIYLCELASILLRKFWPKWTICGKSVSGRWFR